MALAELVEAVRARRGAAAARVSEDDVLRAIGQLRQLGGGWDVLAVGGQRLVRSVPTELTSDGSTALAAAAARGGCISLAQLQSATGWRPDRAQAALDALLREGLALIDTQAEDGHDRYWFGGRIEQQ
jgi:ESCRT-II complex subunit VPS22